MEVVNENALVSAEGQDSGSNLNMGLIQAGVGAALFALGYGLSVLINGRRMKKDLEEIKARQEVMQAESVEPEATQAAPKPARARKAAQETPEGAAE